jgi:hypothetical protein
MSNVASIDDGHRNRKGGFLGSYIKAQNDQRIPEEVFFVAGVILTVGLPELVLSIYGGLTPFIVLASTLLAGGGLGLVAYCYKLPHQTMWLDTEAISRVPMSESDMTKKAA